MMPEINFSEIRGDSANGRRDGFEEFVCQLARKYDDNIEGEFRRIEGSGGDGGVEAYWLLNDGSKIGFQAKYWLRSGGIDWRQIDKSVEQALSTHPELSKYVIAIPCDLTGKSGARDRGKTGWEHWDTHKTKWERIADGKKINVEFIIWPESELIRLATEKLHPGAIRYWFDIELLTPLWFENHAKKSLVNLGMRYQPKINVDTSINEFFDTFYKRKVALKDLQKNNHDVLHDIMQGSPKHLDSFDKENIKIINSFIENYMKAFRERCSEFKSLSDKFWTDACLNILFDWNVCFRDLDRIVDEMFDTLESCRKHLSKLDYSSPEVKDINVLLHSINYDIAKLRKNIRQNNLKPYGKVCFLLSGTFGTGKSHALGRLIEALVEQKRPALLLLGQQFGSEDPQKQILRKIDCAHLNFSEFLGAMNCASEEAGQIGIIAIDALNEGAGLHIWKDHLAGLLTEIEKHDHLRLIVSYRPEYENMLIPEPVKAKSFKYEIRGFQDDVDFEKACTVLMDELGIQRPSSPFLPPIFYNPLFLSQICKKLHRENKRSFPDGLEGLSNLLDYYLEDVAKAIQRQYNLPVTTSKDIQEGLRSLAQQMASGQTTALAKSIAEELLSSSINPTPPSGLSWLQTLLDTGALRADPDPDKHSESFSNTQEIIRFSFQAFEEYMIAYALWKSLNGQYKNIFKKNGQLAFMLDTTSKARFNYEWNGVLMALWVIFAEKEEVELVDLMSPELVENHQCVEMFEDSLYWRSSKCITERTTKLLNCLNLHDIFRILSSFFLVKDHPWNANYLHERLMEYSTMVERDAVWTNFINNEFEHGETPIDNQLTWIKNKKISPLDEEAALLGAIFLAWQLGSTRIKHRDESTMLLVDHFIQNPSVIPKILKQFHDVDDFYIKERLYAAAYGACHFIDDDNVQSVAEITYELILSKEAPLHILLRDAIQGIIDRAKFLGVFTTTFDFNKCKPSKHSLYPLQYHSNDEIDKLASTLGDEHKTLANSCTTEYGRGISAYGDFGRYVLEIRTDYFSKYPLDKPPPDIPSRNSRHDGELIGNWVAHRAYNYGWNSTRFPSDVGMSYSRSLNILERFGKKYQWIAMYELLGILADNYWLSDKYGDNPEYRKYTSIEDIPFCRTIDPTLRKEISIHDITPLDEKLPIVSIPSITDGKDCISKWISGNDRLEELDRELFARDNDGNEWVLLYHFMNINNTNDLDEESSFKQSPYPSTFSRITAFFVERDKRDSFIERNKSHRQANPLSLTRKIPEDNTAFKYLFERDWKNLEPSPVLVDDSFDRITPHLLSIDNYYYSSQRDANFSDDYSLNLPTSSIIAQHDLVIHRETPNILHKTNDEIVFYTKKNYKDRRNYFVQDWLRRDIFDKFLDDNGLCCVWVAGGVKEVVFDTKFDLRYFNKLTWLEGEDPEEECWFE